MFKQDKNKEEQYKEEETDGQGKVRITHQTMMVANTIQGTTTALRRTEEGTITTGSTTMWPPLLHTMQSRNILSGMGFGNSSREQLQQ